MTKYVEHPSNRQWLDRPINEKKKLKRKKEEKSWKLIPYHREPFLPGGNFFQEICDVFGCHHVL